MDRRRFLAWIPALAAIGAAPELFARGELGKGLVGNSTRFRFVEAGLEADFWVWNTQPVKAIPLLRRALSFGEVCATAKEMDELSYDLKACQNDLEALRERVQLLRNQVSREPTNPGPRLALAQTLLDIGRYDEASQASLHALQILPELSALHRADFLDKAAFSSYCLGEYPKALQQIDTALQLWPGPDEIGHLLLQNKLLILCALRHTREAELAASQYRRLHGSLPFPLSYRLRQIGIDLAPGGGQRYPRHSSKEEELHVSS